jgi:hypothetical protein
MYFVLDIWHGASTLDEIPDSFEIVLLAGFEALAIVKNEMIVVWRDYFGIDVRYPCFPVRDNLWMTVSGGNS